MTFKNTGVICMIQIPDLNREEGFKNIDVGNYFIAPDGTQCLITSAEEAQKYQDKIDVPIYIRTRGNT